MWKHYSEIRLIRFEGIEDFTQCSLLLDDSQIEVLYPSNPGKFFTLDSTGIYKITVTGDSDALSVSFNMNLFKEDGMLWLPIFRSSESFISSLPDEVLLPRVLILCQIKKIEDTFSSICSEESFVECEFMPQIKLFNYENVHNCLRENQLQVIYEVTNTVKNHEGLDVRIRNLRENDPNLLINAAVIIQEDLKKELTKAEELADKLEEKNEELVEVYKNIHKVKGKITWYKAENLVLKACDRESLQRSVDYLNQKIREAKETIQDLQSKSRKNKHCSMLEQAVNIECEQLNIPVLEKDLNEEVFSYKGKKVNLLVENGKLMCRIGTSVKDFKKYAKERDVKSNANGFNLVSPFRKPFAATNRQLEGLRDSKSSDTARSSKTKEGQTSKHFRKCL